MCMDARSGPGVRYSQGTKSPLRALDPLHAASRTMPTHVICLAAAGIWSKQQLGGPAKSEQRPCAWAVRSPTPRAPILAG